MNLTERGRKRSYFKGRNSEGTSLAQHLAARELREHSPPAASDLTNHVKFGDIAGNPSVVDAVDQEGASEIQTGPGQYTLLSRKWTRPTRIRHVSDPR